MMKEALKQVSFLVERFQQNIEAYRNPAYNETQLRIEFIDPFFEALGWDVANKAGYAEQYKDVVHEDAIKVAGATKAPDYCFRIGGVRKFFLETKKPSVGIKDQTGPAYQLRRYAWSAKLPLSILTNFEELAIYDCRLRPKSTDKPSIGRIRYYTYPEYLDSFEEIHNLLSKESVLKGSFDKVAESDRQKRGTTEVDAEFLKEIESWREILAKNIAARNPKLSVRELNAAVQLTIDRIIFLRMCEDRGIESYGQIQSLLNGTNTYHRLRELFYHADGKYNSGLFDFKADHLTPELKIDDNPLKDIFQNLYYPESPYEFSVLSADILGHVYEQFLGKVIRLTEGHHAKVEEKPEVRKAGGVYYTPTYIVDYIVKNTVGKIVRAAPRGRPEKDGEEIVGATRRGRPIGLTPQQISKIRILDPACGSGSFLLGAYQYLLDYHRDWYQKDGSKKHTKDIYQGHGGQWNLTIQEKKRILLNNIYGVDIDTQAVEVTKLSLLLKVLESENQDTLERQMKLFKERALPDLASNIKCGNSLIGPDFYKDRQMNLLEPEEMYRVNPFDWEKEFPEIMKRGGFDVVIGNPPYGALINEAEAQYLGTKFETTNRDLDTYSLFMELAVRLSKPNGKISMIVPTGWYSGVKFSNLRRFIACMNDPQSFVNLPYDIFGAWVDTSVFVLVKRRSPTIWPRTIACNVILKTFPKRHRITSESEIEEGLRSANFTEWFANDEDEFLTYADSIATRLIHKIQSNSKPLKEFADVQRGVTPFNLTDSPTHATSRRAFNGTVRRYSIEQKNLLYIRFDDTLAEPKPERYFKGLRLLLREMISRKFRLQAVKVTDSFITNKSMQSILAPLHFPDINYLLGLINSTLISWYFLHRSNIAQRDDFPKIVLKETRSLPIHPMHISNPADKGRHDQLVDLVQQILDLHKLLKAAKTAHDKTILQRQIDSTDRQIDRLVYELYDLTDEEIKIVEEQTK
jgi:type I restriction-modification system DNA methylase subunit